MEDYKNQKGFKILKLSRPECDICHFGFWDNEGYHIIDDYLNIPIQGDVYYVAILNICLSQKALYEWYNNESTIHYKKDERYELAHYNNIKKLIENYGRN